MPQITAIEPQKRKLGRFNVFVDGEFSFALSEKILANVNLRIGQKITQAKIEKIISEYELSKNFEKVLKFLSFRPRSKKEILDYLKKKNLGEGEKKLILTKLEKLKMVNDLEFAKFFVEGRVKFKPKSIRLLTVELRQKGVDKEIIENVFTQAQVVDLDLAQTAISKKLPRFLKMPEKEAKNKIVQFLARRGFLWETIQAVIDKVIR